MKTTKSKSAFYPDKTFYLKIKYFGMDEINKYCNKKTF